MDIDAYLLKPKDNQLRRRIFYVAVAVITIWLVVASITYALRHPEQTDTQRFLHTWDALKFR